MSKNYQNAIDTEIYRITIGIIIYRIILNILNCQIVLISDNKINHKFWIYEITLELRNYQNARNNLNYWITLKISNYLSILIKNYQIIHHFHKLQIYPKFLWNYRIASTGQRWLDFSQRRQEALV